MMIKLVSKYGYDGVHARVAGLKVGSARVYPADHNHRRWLARILGRNADPHYWLATKAGPGSKRELAGFRDYFEAAAAALTWAGRLAGEAAR